MYRFMMPGLDLQLYIGPTVRPKITKSIRIICVTVKFMLTSHELSSYHPIILVLVQHHQSLQHQHVNHVQVHPWSPKYRYLREASPQWSCHPRPKLCQLPGPWCEQCGQMVEGSDVHLVHCDSSNGNTLVMWDETVKFAVGLWVFGRLLNTNYSRDLSLSTLQIVLHGSRGICWRPTKHC